MKVNTGFVESIAENNVLDSLYDEVNIDLYFKKYIINFVFCIVKMCFLVVYMLLQFYVHALCFSDHKFGDWNKL